ncbi:hypothetical protein PPERSA_03090 [Pseudocohnilembus persalinus]|uniref:Uncharacterized protein n=1 Tax=Pseudocohnilembus persalinus TaxID=266149 RepID=A0A0V0QLH4_PSEPJ|nr:hypothetical protein PPERSA_03090 [Pseudocohnilembus persalinus]|eukprot:KRX02999.1 hypothetical protein PPERSA_03090 [Pseudocohnilembus persalinus]
MDAIKSNFVKYDKSSKICSQKINTQKEQSRIQSPKANKQTNQKYGSKVLFPTSFKSTSLLNDSNIKLNINDSKSEKQIDQNTTYVNEMKFLDFSSEDLEYDYIDDIKLQQLPQYSDIQKKKNIEMFKNSDSNINSFNNSLNQSLMKNKIQQYKIGSHNNSPEIGNLVNNKFIFSNDYIVFQEQQDDNEINDDEQGQIIHEDISNKLNKKDNFQNMNQIQRENSKQEEIKQNILNKSMQNEKDPESKGNIQEKSGDKIICQKNINKNQQQNNMNLNYNQQNKKYMESNVGDTNNQINFN